MTARTRAREVKTALYEITKELVANRSYSPTKAISELRKRNGKEIQISSKDIEDYGLRAIAGLVRGKRVKSDEQGDLWRIKEFDTYTYKTDTGQYERRVVNVLDCSLEDYDNRIIPDKKPKLNNASEMTAEDYFREMREKGVTGITLRDYLRSR